MKVISIRWFFALVAMICGIYLLVRSAGNSLVIAGGIAAVSAGIGLVVV